MPDVEVIVHEDHFWNTVSRHVQKCSQPAGINSRGRRSLQPLENEISSTPGGQVETTNVFFVVAVEDGTPSAPPEPIHKDRFERSTMRRSHDFELLIRVELDAERHIELRAAMPMELHPHELSARDGAPVFH